MPKEFNNAILKLSDKVKRTLEFLPDATKQKCEEIRLRAALPVCLTVGGRVVFVCKDSTVCDSLPGNPFIATQADVTDSLAKL